MPKKLPLKLVSESPVQGTTGDPPPYQIWQWTDGYELADQIKETYFGTKDIMMTGHYESDVVDMIRASSIVNGFLFKPFTFKPLKKQS